MKVKQFTDVLAQAGQIYRAGGDTDKQQALQDFSKLFDKQEKKTISAFIKLIQNKRQAIIKPKR